MLEVMLNPGNQLPSTNGPICAQGSMTSSMHNRCQSFVAELGLNTLVGNGPIFGLRGKPDVPPDIEVKWSKRGDKLIVSKRYLQPDLRYVLASGNVEYLGWAFGREIVRPWMKHAFYLPVSNLRNMGSLSPTVRQPLSYP